MIREIAAIPKPSGADGAELALALGVWASIERSFSRLDTAGAALWRAHRVIQDRPAFYARGELCQRAVLLLLDLRRRPRRRSEASGDARRSRSPLRMLAHPP